MVYNETLKFFLFVLSIVIVLLINLKVKMRIRWIIASVFVLYFVIFSIAEKIHYKYILKHGYKSEFSTENWQSPVAHNNMKQKFKSEIYAFVDINFKSHKFNVVTYHTFNFEKETILIESHEEQGVKYYHLKMMSSTRTGDVFRIEVTSNELSSINEVSFNPNLEFLFYSGDNETYTYGRLTKIY